MNNTFKGMIYFFATVTFLYCACGCAQISSSVHDENQTEIALVSNTTFVMISSPTPTSTATPTPNPTPDPNRKLTGITTYKNLNGTKILIQDIFFQYNEKGLLIYYNDGVEHYYTYDQFNRLVEDNITYSSIDLSTNENDHGIRKYYYNDEGLLEKIESIDYMYNLVGSGEICETTFYYDDFGRMIRKTYKSSYSDSSIDYIYNDQCLEKIQMTVKTDLYYYTEISKRIEEFFYDDNDQVNKRVCVSDTSPGGGYKVEEIYEPIPYIDPYWNWINPDDSFWPDYSVLAGSRPVQTNYIYSYSPNYYGDGYDYFYNTPVGQSFYDERGRLIKVAMDYSENPSTINDFEFILCETTYVYSEYDELLSTKEVYTDRFGDVVYSIEYIYEYTYDR